MEQRRSIPFPILQTEKLRLRQLSSIDADAIFVLRSDSEVNKYLNRIPSKSIDEARIFIEKINESIEKNDSIYWAITLCAGDRLIGTICLYNFSEETSTAEIGFELIPGYQGKGIMRQALAMVIDFGIQHAGIKAIEAYTHFDNQTSIRLLEKSNFKLQDIDADNLIRYRLTSAAMPGVRNGENL